MPNSHLLKGAIVVSMDDDIGTQSDCDILIQNGIITSVGPNLSSPSPDIPTIDASDFIISPGFVDTHRHAWQTQLKNITSDSTLKDYFLYIRNVYGSCYTPKDAYIGELMGALESIDAGVTFMLDHSHIMNSPEHSDAVVKALKDSRMRAVFCYGLFVNNPWEGIEQGTSTFTDPNGGKDWRLEDAKRIREKHFSKENAPTDLVRFGFAPAEVEASPLEQSISELQFGRSLGAAVITGHIAMGQMNNNYPFIRTLNEKGLLGPDLVFSHASALNDEELAMVKKEGVGLAITPDTEMQMGMGPCLTPRADALGCRHGLGIDVSCNNPIDMFQQMRLLLQSERNRRHLAAGQPPLEVAYTCAQVLKTATLGGAQCVGLGDVIGSITPGKRADLIMTSTKSPRMTPVNDPVAALVLYANASDVDTVMVDGRIVKKGGQFVDFDWGQLRAEVVSSTREILERAKGAPLEEITARIFAGLEIFK